MEFTGYKTIENIETGDQRPKIEYFLIGASTVNNELDYIAMLSDVSASAAHSKTAEAYRREFNLPSSRHIFTATLYKTTDEKEVTRIYDNLMKKILQEMGKD